MIEIFVFLFGIIIGSFLNVCIARMPHGESIIHPPSRCPGCKKSIVWYDNIPLLSFLVLGGKCRNCKIRISFRYFAVELANGIFWVLLFLRFGFNAPFYVGAIFFSLLLAVTVTDFETGLIPDMLSIPGMIMGLAASMIWPELMHKTLWYQGAGFSMLGLLGAGGILYATALLGDLIFRKESMGGGDIKLLAMIGSFLGFQKACVAFLFSPFLALPFALYLKVVKKAETFPYGPFLAVAGAVFFIYGEVLIKFIFPANGV